MRITGLRLRNIKSYENLEIGFTEGNNIIIGPNGAGKTTILEGVLYALFGIYPGRNMANLVRRGKRLGEVTLRFTAGHDTYEVHRQLEVHDGETPTTSARLWKIGKDEPIADKQKGATVEIERILGVDRDTFENLIFIKQGEIPEIAAIQPNKRKALFDKLLGLDIYEQCWKNTGEVTREHESRRQQLSKERSILEEDAGKLPEAKRQLEEFEKERAKLTAQLRTITTEKQNVDREKERLDALGKEVSGLTSSIETLTANLQEDDESIGQSAKQLRERREEPVSLKVDEITARQRKTGDSLVVTQTKLATASETVKHLEALQTRLAQAEQFVTQTREENLAKQREADKLLASFPASAPFLQDKSEVNWHAVVQDQLQGVDGSLVEERGKQKQLQTKLQAYKSAKDQLAKEQKRLKKIKSDLSVLTREAKTELGPDWIELARKDTARIDSELAQLNAESSRLAEEGRKAQTEVTRLDTLLADLDKQIRQATKLKGTCPLCKQEVSAEHLKSVLQRLQTERTQLYEQLGKATKESSLLQQRTKENATQLEETGTLRNTVALTKRTHRELENLQKQVQTEATHVQELQEQLTELKEFPCLASECEKRINALDAQVRNLQSLQTKVVRLSSLRASAADAQSRLTQHENEARELGREFDPQALKRTQDARADLEEEKTRLAAVRACFQSLVTQVKRRDRDKKRLDTLASRLKRLSSEYDASRHHAVTIRAGELSGELGETRGSFQKLEKEQIPAQTELVNGLQQKTRRYQELQQLLELSDRQQKVLELLRAFFRSVQPPLRRSHVSRVSTEATRLFSHLIDSREYDCLRVNENYDILVSRYGQEEEVNNLSGGEQVLACLAIRLALAQARAGQDFLMLDEPTAHLDETRKRELIAVFERTRPTGQLVAVTHESEFDSAADSVIRVDKADGVSGIAEG